MGPFFSERAYRLEYAVPCAHIPGKSECRPAATSFIRWMIAAAKPYSIVRRKIIDMFRFNRPRCGAYCLLLFLCLAGCAQEPPTHALDADLARRSLVKAMEAWSSGKTPKDLQPEIVVGDSEWEKGRKLASFEVLSDEETTDGSNLHIRVKRKFEDDSGESESKVTYIVGTSPVISIFPQ